MVRPRAAASWQVFIPAFFLHNCFVLTAGALSHWLTTTCSTSDSLEPVGVYQISLPNTENATSMASYLSRLTISISLTSNIYCRRVPRGRKSRNPSTVLSLVALPKPCVTGGRPNIRTLPIHSFRICDVFSHLDTSQLLLGYFVASVH